MVTGCRVGIIGAGASGLMAAYKLADKCQVTLFEKKDIPGKKLSITGNGRCNFTNQDMSSSKYYSSDSDYRAFLDKCFEKYNEKSLIRDFEALGILCKNKNGYWYPYSEQASGVRDAFLCAIKEKNVSLCNEEVINITHSIPMLVKTASGNEFEFDYLMICTGSSASEKKADNIPNTYGLELETKPFQSALTFLNLKVKSLKMISGQRTDGRIGVYCLEDDSLLGEDTGNLQWTDSGISGIPTFNVSHCVSDCLNNNKKAYIKIDLFANTQYEDKIVFEKLCRDRIEKRNNNSTLSDFLTGLAPVRVNSFICDYNGLVAEKKLNKLSEEELMLLLNSYRELIFEVISTGDIMHSQVCMGGVLLSNLAEDFELKKYPHIYGCGELLDIDGICGGYNLTFAFMSASIAANSILGELI